MATGGGAGYPDHSSPDDVTTPKSVIPADSNSDDETSSALTINGQDGTEICRVGKGQFMIQNVLAPLSIGEENTFIKTQHIHYHHSETEDSTEDMTWSEFDEAQSLNTQDVSPEDLDRAVELLNHYGRIALCGPPKSGKSSLAHALLKHYKGQGFTAYLVNKLCCHYQLTKGRKGRSIVLMDGSLGVLRVDKDQFKACKDLKNRCFLIMTFYPHVLRDLAVQENQACPLLPPSVVITMDPHPHHPLSAVDYLTLFELMISESEQTLPALLALCLQGSCHFDQKPLEVAHSLQHLGFSSVSPCDLRPVANILKGSLLPQTHSGFPSRVENDAAGLALGCFYPSLLLQVCDITFLLQHVRTSGIPAKSVIVIGPGEKAYPQLLQRMYEMLVDGQMSELCQHPSLGCSAFLRDLRAFCAQHKNYEQRLTDAVDRKHGLPLLYWSLWNQSTQLTQWCLTIMTKHITFSKVLSKSLLCAALATVLFAADTDIKSRAQCFLADLTLMKFNLTTASKLTLILPLLTEAEHQTVTANMSAKLCKLKADGICYLDNPSLVIPTSLLSINITEYAVSVELSSQHWNLALRLVADRHPDETDNSGDTLLHLSAYTEHLEVIKIAIKSGASVTINNKKGQFPYHLAQRRQTVQKDGKSYNADVTSLHRACKKGDVEKVKVALCHKSSVHDREGNWNSPLHTACGAGKAEVVSLLIQLGAMIDCKGQWGNTPLHCACVSGDMNTVRLLLQQGAEVNGKNGEGWTPLHVACHNCHTEVSSLLLQHGAEVNGKNGTGWTPLHVACHNGHTEVSSLLLQHGAEINGKNGSGWTPLRVACGKGHTEVSSLLLQHGAEINGKDGEGWTPLHLVCHYGHTDVSSLLLQHGAVVNGKNDKGYTPLHFACWHGRTEVFSLLLQHGAEVNVKDGKGLTPLLFAIRNGHTEVLSLLLQHGAEVNGKDDSGMTPLHVACHYGDTEVSSLLLQHGAEVNMKDKYGKTAADIARDTGHEKLLTILHTPV